MERRIGRMDRVRVKATGKEGVARFIGRHGLVCVDFDEPNPLGRSIYNPAELEIIVQESEGKHNETRNGGTADNGTDQ